MRGREHTLTTVWSRSSPPPAERSTPRDDLLAEVEVSPGTFEQAAGPFRTYRRTISTDDGTTTERITYLLAIPWFGLLFALPVRYALRRPRAATVGSPWWAPPDRLTERQATTLALLAAAAMSAAFTNTLFTQTANFAADTFGIGDRGQGFGGAAVRLGVIIALPLTVVADRVGRRRIIILTAWLAPALCAIGALAPNFWLLVASQSVARPMGLALALVATVAAAEEMPRNSRAYALSLLAMSAGLGTGIAVAALKLADFGAAGWRLVYLLSLMWIPVAVSLLRHLLETHRFETRHRIAPPLDRRRLAMVSSVEIASAMFIAPSSFFLNRYLDHVHGFSAGRIALFTLLTATPASIGLVLGGHLADVVGRRVLIAISTPMSTVCLVGVFVADGWMIWAGALVGGFTAALAHSAFAVYRTELFPTGNRSRASGIILTIELLAGSVGILIVGVARDHGSTFGAIMIVMGLGQLLAAFIAYHWYPETAHLELEQLNPEDPVLSER